jgi:hypothetical protein
MKARKSTSPQVTRIMTSMTRRRAKITKQERRSPRTLRIKRRALLARRGSLPLKSSSRSRPMKVQTQMMIIEATLSL